MSKLRDSTWFVTKIKRPYVIEESTVPGDWSPLNLSLAASRSTKALGMLISGVCSSSHHLCFMISYYKLFHSQNKLLTLRSGIGDCDLCSWGFWEEIKYSLASIRESLALGQDGKTCFLSCAASLKHQKILIDRVVFFSSSWTHNPGTSRATFSPSPFRYKRTQQELVSGSKCG